VNAWLFEVPYLPAYRPHFFQGEKRSKFGVRLIRGYKSFELIHMQNCPTHTESTKITESLTVWLNVLYEVKLIHVFEEFCFSTLQWVYLVSEYVCYWIKSKKVCMSSHEALLMPFTWNRVCLFAELHEKYTKPVTKRKSYKWNWYKISQFRSSIHIVMSSAINKRCGFIFTLRMFYIHQKRNLKPLNTQCVTQCFWYNSHSRQTFCLPVSPVNV